MMYAALRLRPECTCTASAWKCAQLHSQVLSEQRCRRDAER